MMVEARLLRRTSCRFFVRERRPSTLPARFFLVMPSLDDRQAVLRERGDHRRAARPEAPTRCPSCRDIPRVRDPRSKHREDDPSKIRRHARRPGDLLLQRSPRGSFFSSLLRIEGTGPGLGTSFAPSRVARLRIAPSGSRGTWHDGEDDFVHGVGEARNGLFTRRRVRAATGRACEYNEPPSANRFCRSVVKHIRAGLVCSEPGPATRSEDAVGSQLLVRGPRRRTRASMFVTVRRTAEQRHERKTVDITTRESRQRCDVREGSGSGAGAGQACFQDGSRRTGAEVGFVVW